MDTEVKRKILHVLAALLPVPFLLFFDLLLGVVIAIVGLALIALIWSLEQGGRELKGPARQGQEFLARTMEETMRPEERFPWAPYYFVGGLIIVAALTEALDLPLSLAFAAYAILGFGDAASALIGKAYGSLPIPWNEKKSWEGTGAGIGTSYPWALLLASVYYVYLDVLFPVHLYWVVLAGTVVGMLVETLPGEDNLTIPVASWATMAALVALFGL